LQVSLIIDTRARLKADWTEFFTTS